MSADDVVKRLEQQAEDASGSAEYMDLIACDAAAVCAEYRRLQNVLSDDVRRQERLDEIARLADSDIRTGSRDRFDWIETMEYILAIARGLKGPK